jgi:transposase
MDNAVMEFMLACMAKSFLPYTIDQRLLLPPDMRDWLPEGHLASYVSDVVEALDLSKIYAVYETGDDRGRAGYHPKMLVKLLVYGYCIGVKSSRRIERATQEDVAFRVLSGDQHPDHDIIATFRKTHLKELGRLFAQVLRLCQRAGLVKLGHIAIDGSKIQANASKHKAMSYGRMSEAEKALEKQVEELLREAEQVDAEEDARYGKGKRGDELPKELARRESRLKKIREAKEALEAEAKEEAEHAAKEAERKLEERAHKEAETGKKSGGKPPKVVDPEEAKPDPKAQRNFTDPGSRIMPDGAHKGSFTQAYNVQVAVDGHAQIIVATNVVQEANDKQQLEPMAQAIVENVGRLAEVTSADAGYFSEQAIERVGQMGTELLVPPNRQKHRDSQVAERSSKSEGAAGRMRSKLQTETGRNHYKMRKAIVEPVFGQIKEARGLRRFAMRGFENVCDEFDFIAMTHNLLKLFRFAPRALVAGG